MASESKVWMYILGGIGGTLLLAGMASAGKKKGGGKSLFFPGETIDAFMGQLITVRLPRGDYSIVADRAVKSAEVDIGTSTDIVLVVGFAHAPYQERVNFVSVGAGAKQYFVNLSVHPLPEAARI